MSPLCILYQYFYYYYYKNTFQGVITGQYNINNDKIYKMKKHIHIIIIIYHNFNCFLWLILSRNSDFISHNMSLYSTTFLFSCNCPQDFISTIISHNWTLIFHNGTFLFKDKFSF